MHRAFCTPPIPSNKGRWRTTSTADVAVESLDPVGGAAAEIPGGYHACFNDAADAVGMRLERG
jgi:hypothetical protein